MLRINIDGTELKAYAGQTILEIARGAGISIPTLCHDERLKPYGGCGLCVVQREGGNRLIRACATEVEDGMIIYTDNPRIRESRRTTLALLLSDHSGDCRGPCIKGCPAHTDVQGYVGLIANGQYREAVQLIKEKLPIPASIGRVCPHPCEDVCRRQLVEAPISVAALKYFVADYDLNSGNPYRPQISASTGKRAAIVGAGPAGLTCAYYLAAKGHRVQVFDAMPKGGGMLRYGIPEYRLPKDVIDREIAMIADMGVEFQYNTKIGRDLTMDYLCAEYDSVFVGIGAWEASSMRCEGETLPGVYGGIDFLRMVAMDQPVEIGRKVAVVGGGNTAMDAARTAVRLGADEVMVLYRRTRAEMPAEDIEIKEAEEEGVVFRYLVAPLEVLAVDGRAGAIRLQKMELGAPDASGRRSPVPIEGAEETIQLDSVISAIGQAVDSRGVEGFDKDRWGSPKLDKVTMQTSNPRIFAGGDVVDGPGIAITAVAHGRKAALAMDAYMMGLELPYAPGYLVERQVTAEDFTGITPAERLEMPHMKPAERRTTFRESNIGYTEEQARKEASRCLECGCKDYFECRLIKYTGEYDADPSALDGEKRYAAIINEHPYIERDGGKCILCGLCVRVCEEVVGVTALGLVKRGFECVVAPEFGLPLNETGCISCGQCVALCPTGALTEKFPQDKTIPLDTDQSESLCLLCGMGCRQTVHSYGSSIVKTVPSDGGLLCSKGRFAFEFYHQDRIDRPMIRKDGELQVSSREEVLRSLERSLKSLRRLGGPEAVGIAISPLLSLEEGFALKSLGSTVLGSEPIFSFTRNTSRGLEKVLGINRSTLDLSELQAADFVLQVGSLSNSQVAAVRIRQAVQSGAGLAVISERPGINDDIAQYCCCPRDGLTFLKEIQAALLESQEKADKFIKERSSGYESLASSLAGIEISPLARDIARAYSQARFAAIVADGSSISRAGVEMLAQLAVITGHLDTPRQGIMVVNSDANQVGHWSLGIRDCFHQHLDAIRTGQIKALVIAGEDPIGAGLISKEDLSKVECLAVLSSTMTQTAQVADFVLPIGNAMEKGGTFVNYQGKIQKVNPFMNGNLSGTAVDIVEELAKWFDVSLPVFDLKRVEAELKSPVYRPSALNEVSAAYQLYPVLGDELFMPVSLADPVKRLFAGRQREDKTDTTLCCAN